VRFACEHSIQFVARYLFPVTNPPSLRSIAAVSSDSLTSSVGYDMEIADARRVHLLVSGDATGMCELSAFGVFPVRGVPRFLRRAPSFNIPFCITDWAH
jgi:hypothetical protein